MATFESAVLAIKVDSRLQRIKLVLDGEDKGQEKSWIVQEF